VDRVAIHVDISGDNLAANERQFGAMKGQQSIEGTDHYGSLRITGELAHSQYARSDQDIH
jgi:autotransporter translocation and assembly factor TamB